MAMDDECVRAARAVGRHRPGGVPAYRHIASFGGRLTGHIVAIVVGFVLMVVGLALGVTMVLLPIGLLVGVIGVLVFVWGLLAYRISS